MGKVLVINATGRQGAATVDALLATKRFKVFGTTRTGVSAKLAEKGVQAVKFQYDDPASCEAAIKEAAADLVWFTTLMSSRAKVFSHASCPSWLRALPIHHAPHGANINHVPRIAPAGG